MSRNLIFAASILFSTFAYSGTDEMRLQGLKLIYPHGKRTVAISFQYNDSRIIKIDYQTSEVGVKSISKAIGQKQSNELLSQWKKSVAVVANAKTELSCDLSEMWVLEFYSAEKKVLCRNKKAIDEISKFQNSIQFMLLEI